MNVSIDISTETIIRGMMTMDVNELEIIKNAIIERGLYFQKFKKDKIENIIADFKAEGYAEAFLNDLENGLKMSSVYNENKTS